MNLKIAPLLSAVLLAFSTFPAGVASAQAPMPSPAMAVKADTTPNRAPALAATTSPLATASPSSPAVAQGAGAPSRAAAAPSPRASTARATPAAGAAPSVAPPRALAPLPLPPLVRPGGAPVNPSSPSVNQEPAKEGVPGAQELCKVRPLGAMDLDFDAAGGRLVVRFVSDNKQGCLVGVASDADWVNVDLEKESNEIRVRVPPHNTVGAREAEVYVATRSQTFTLRLYQKGLAPSAASASSEPTSP